MRPCNVSRWAKTFDERAARRRAILDHYASCGNKAATARHFGVHPSYVYQLLRAVTGYPVEEHTPQ